MNELAPSDTRVPKQGFGSTAHLLGNKLVRMTYLDESGASRREPTFVVAGVIEDVDRQMLNVEKHLLGLVTKHIPEEHRRGFVFHAADIWCSAKFFKDKAAWPWERRAEILKDLADIPAKFGLPIVYGMANKERIKSHLEPSIRDSLFDLVCHCSAYTSATHALECFMAAHCNNEFTIIVAEDRPESRKAIKRLQSALQGKSTELPDDIVREFAELPFHHIRDTVHFAGKKESAILQVADTCSFFIRGVVDGNLRAQPFFGQILRTLLPPPGVKLGMLHAE